MTTSVEPRTEADRPHLLLIATGVRLFREYLLAPIAQRYRPSLFRLGRWHWRTGIAALSEIAAGAFAQALLELPCHPRVLDLIARDALSKNASTAHMASAAG